jgi:hypothetical protein
MLCLARNPGGVSCLKRRRTMDAPYRWARTRVVRLIPRVFIALAAGLLLGSRPESAAADADSTGRQERLQAEGWLQLKQDQKSFREGAEPLPPREAAALDHLERRQRTRFEELKQEQRRSSNRERSLGRRDKPERPVSRPRHPDTGRQFDRQRLDMRIQRETLSPGRR